MDSKGFVVDLRQKNQPTGNCAGKMPLLKFLIGKTPAYIV